MGVFDWLFKGSKVEPTQVPFGVPGQLNVLQDWLFSPFFFNQESNTWELRGVPPFPGQLSPNMEDTMLPEVYKQYQAGNPGMAALQNMMQQPNNPIFQQLQDSYMQYGGAGGLPTDLMRRMVDWGGVGKKGHQAVDMTMQYGAPSQVGQFMSSAAQFGIPSEAGRPVHSRATGAETAAMNFLIPFMNRPTAPGPGGLSQFMTRPPERPQIRIGG